VEHRSADVEAGSVVSDAVVESMEGKIAGDPAALLLIHVRMMLMMLMMMMMMKMMRILE
jgi:hypothetical protein